MAIDKAEEEVAFGMTLQDIEKTVEALSKHRDINHPSKSGSYDDFLSVVKKGHDALLKQENYGKINL